MSVNGLTPPPSVMDISEKVGVFLGGKVRGVMKKMFFYALPYIRWPIVPNFTVRSKK